MEKKEKNEDLEQLQIDDNYAMSKDVLDTFNYFMDFYSKILKSSNEEFKIFNEDEMKNLVKKTQH